MSEEKVVEEKLAQFVKEMQPLDAEFAQILHDNLWDLYLESRSNEAETEFFAIDQFFDEDEIEECVVTLKEWNDMTANRVFIPDDGDAYYGTSTDYSHICAFMEYPPQWATHVILFGK